MQHSHQLQKKIMRRVYYAFAINVMSHPMTMSLGAFVVLGWMLKELVFVARVWESFTTTPVGELDAFAFKLFGNADVLTLLVFALVCAAGISLVRQLQRLPTLQLAT